MSLPALLGNICPKLNLLSISVFDRVFNIVSEGFFFLSNLSCFMVTPQGFLKQYGSQGKL